MKYLSTFDPDSTYHIFNRAIGNELLFREPTNYHHFLKLLANYILPIGNLLCYSLLPNHFHLLIHFHDRSRLHHRYVHLKGLDFEQQELDCSKFISQQFSNCFNAYAKAFNKKYERNGALFIDYVKRVKVDNEQYFKNLVHYIHYNAVHHELCHDIADWPWSSYMAMTSITKTKTAREFVLNTFDGKEMFLTFHKKDLRISGDELEFL